MPKFITAVLRTKTTLEFRAATANSPLDAALQDGEVVEEHVITDNQKIVSNQMRDEAATEEWHEKICKDNGVKLKKKKKKAIELSGDSVVDAARAEAEQGEPA